jgi:hypothetical protein
VEVSKSFRFRWCTLLIITISTTNLWSGNVKLIIGGVSDGVERGGPIRVLGGIGMESEILKSGPIKYLLTLETDFLFSTKKGSESTNIYILNLPFFLKYKLWNIHAPYFSTGGFVKLLYSSYLIDGNRMGDLDMTYGPIFGIGYEWDFSNLSLNLEIRYYVGRGNLEFKKREESIKTVMLLFSIKFQ